MHFSRNCLIAGTALLMACTAIAAPSHIKSATAITHVFGDGQKLTSVAVEYDRPIKNDGLNPATFKVDGRTITRVYANKQPLLAEQGVDGRYAIIELSPDDSNAVLYGRDHHTIIRKNAQAAVIQTGPVTVDTNQQYAASPTPVKTKQVINLIVDDFRPLVFRDPKTHTLLRYNLFVPRHYDKSKSYPLVLFMHDAGATSPLTRTTLIQGLGAVSWASPAAQARHEAFVLAPQYDSWIVNDQSETTDALETTLHLVDHISHKYAIDKNRLYATGQSGGAMMSLAMNIKYPDRFAASFIVAGQWDAEKSRALANSKLWIMVAEGDEKAYPGENAITEALEKEGASISRAVWDGRSSPATLNAEAQKMIAAGNAINYVVLRKGTVVPEGQEDNGGGNHVNTWRIAYTIDSIRDWIFAQHK